jgi:hypothetical protein
MLFQGERAAVQFRFWTGKVSLCLFAAYAGFYYFKYNANVSFVLKNNTKPNREGNLFWEL